MEEFRAVDAGSISQKENNPYFAEDGEIVNSNIKMSIQQVGGRWSTSDQWMKTRWSNICRSVNFDKLIDIQLNEYSCIVSDKIVEWMLFSTFLMDLQSMSACMYFFYWLDI